MGISNCNNSLHDSGPGTLDASSPYLSIVAMLIESYALDSTWSLTTAVTFALDNPIYPLFETADSTVKVRDLPFASMVPH